MSGFHLEDRFIENMAKEFNLSEEQVLDCKLGELFGRFSMVFGRQMHSSRGPNRIIFVLNSLVVREHLVDIGEVSGPLTQTKLAKYAGITCQSMGELLAKMEASGLVSRSQCETDRRSIYVELAEGGRKMLHDDIPNRVANMSSVFECLSLEEKKQLAAVLSHLNEAN